MFPEIKKITHFHAIDEIPKWKVLYNTVQSFPIGSFFSYSELSTMTGLDILKKDRGEIYIVNRHFLKEMQRMLVNRRNEGYEIATPDKQIVHASKRKKRASKQLKSGILEIVNLDTSKMLADEKIRLQHFMNSLQVSLSILRKRKVESIKITEKAVEKQKEELNDSDAIWEAIEELKRKIS